MIELWKMLNEGYDSEAIPNLLLRDDFVAAGRRNRGHSKQLFITRSEKEVRSNFFTQRVAPIWNALTENVVSAPTINSFKNRLDELWKNNPSKYQYE
jgi:hypothetical protein